MNEIIKFVSELNEEKVLQVVKTEIKKETDPLIIFEWMQLGMEEVGRLYETSEYFIGDLIMAGIIFKQVIEIVNKDTDINVEGKERSLGTILLGTVKGDLHDIGKNIFSGLAQSTGFKVYDLGVDVSPEKFVELTKKIQPDIIGLSGILSSDIESMKEIIDRLKNESLRDQIKIIVGSNAMTKEECEYIGADIVNSDAVKGVEICKKWMKIMDSKDKM